MQITSISRQRLGDEMVVASISGHKDSTVVALALKEYVATGGDAPDVPVAQIRWIGHDHLEALGISNDCIQGWLASGALTSPLKDGFYVRGAAFEPEFERLAAWRIVGRGHLLALGVTATGITRRLQQGTLRRTNHRGFYEITRAAFEILRPATSHGPAASMPSNLPAAPEATIPVPPTTPEPAGLAPPDLATAPRLRVVATTISRARAFVAEHHRHLGAPVSGLFAVGVARGDALVGVAIVGRPVARALQDGRTAEITRICTLGDRNACSMLLSACRRGSSALGYSKLITYTLASEPGTSLRAAGWREVGQVKGRSWNCASRPRTTTPAKDKRRWEPPMRHPPKHGIHVGQVREAVNVAA